MITSPELTADQPELPSGSLVGGRYRIVRLLGRGAMGGVFLAHDTVLGDELVALKVFNRGGHASEDGFERFVREAQIGRKIAHPNVCRVFDLQADGALMYVSMEYVPGQSLAQMIKGGALPESQFVPLIKQIVEGLAAIHFKGVVHRDLKPSNILLTAGNIVKIIDFGLARSIQSDLTVTNALMGTSLYLAPELWDGADPSFASDMYALGVILYQVITGIAPWKGEKMTEMMQAHLEQLPVAPSEIVTVSAGLEDLILSLLDKDPANRPLCDDALFSEIAGVTLSSRRQSGTFAQPTVNTPFSDGPLAASPLAISRLVEPASGVFRQMGVEHSFLAALLLGAVVCAAAIVSAVFLHITLNVFGSSFESPLTMVGGYASIVVTSGLVSAALSRGAFRLGLTSNERAVREVLVRHIRGVAILIWLSLFVPSIIATLPSLSTDILAQQMVTSVFGAAVLFLQIAALTPAQWGVSAVNLGEVQVWVVSSPPSLYSSIVSYLALISWVYLIGGLMRPPRRKVSALEKEENRAITGRFVMILAIESILIILLEISGVSEKLVLGEMMLYLSPTQWIFSLINLSYVYWANLNVRRGGRR